MWRRTFADGWQRIPRDWRHWRGTFPPSEADRVDQDQVGCPLGEETSEPRHHLAAHGMPDDGRLLDIQVVEKGLHVLGVKVPTVRNQRLRGLSPPEAILSDHPVALVRQRPIDVWNRHIEPLFDSYIGHVFERIAEQAYYRFAPQSKLPIVTEWGSWEGADRERKSLELDIVARLGDKRVMTGGVKWNDSPVPAKWHTHHMAMLHRLADAGVKWAHRALEPDSPIIWVAAGGFSPEFESAVRAERAEVNLWKLSDLYKKPGRRRG